MEFYAYRIMIRQYESNHILQCGKLFSQYLVDMYAKIESERLLFLRLNQAKLRASEYIHLRDAVASERDVKDIGQMVILPSSYIGSPRHMHEYIQDGMTFVRRFGKADLFITFTCNPNWKEIKDLLLPGQSASERHDIVARVFKQKLKSLMNVITKGEIFGEVKCYMYSIEWQKRGLPHCHILIWLKERLVTSKTDDIISAELPDPKEDPVLFDIVSKHMIHGPCGSLNLNSPCMSENRCTCHYPRDFIQETQSGNDSYPIYRRRSPEDDGHSFIKKIRNINVEIDNRWVVPYSPLLCKMFDCHINVEAVHSVKAIKYICKYIHKGSDMAVLELNNKNDEITQYQMGRYISTNEAVWRILGFEMHERSPTVVPLHVHLENFQRVFFTEQNAQQIAENPRKTTLTAFFELCQNDPFAKTLLYNEVPQYYLWKSDIKKFVRRKRGTPVANQTDLVETNAIGRVYTVHPNNSDCFYLRMLLHEVKGPTSFDSLKKVNNEICQTYKEACLKLGLLEDDLQWDMTLAEASMSNFPKQNRTLFAIILTTCAPSDPIGLWEKHKESLSEDILREVRIANSNNNIQFSPEIFNEALKMIEDKCIEINNKPLTEFGFSAPTREREDIFDKDWKRETEYNAEQLRTYVEEKESTLTNDQRHAYDLIIGKFNSKSGGILFLDAPGGTGKTFILNLVLAKIRSQKKIAFAVASSGIAATLLEGGRTAHSALKLPLNYNFTDTPTCNIGKNSGNISLK